MNDSFDKQVGKPASQATMVSKLVLASCLFQLVSLSSSLQIRQSGQSSLCTVPSKYKSSGGEADDSPAISAAFAKCSQDATVIFSEGVDYNVLQPISATNLSNVTIQMLGTLHLPKNVTAIQALVNETTEATNATALYWYCQSQTAPAVC